MITHKVSKTSVKASLLKIRRLALALGLFLIAQAGWSVDFYWVGGTSTDTLNANNWATSANGTGGQGITGLPGASDTIYFYNIDPDSTYQLNLPADISLNSLCFWGNVEITVNGNCSITNFKMEAPDNTLYVNQNFTAKLLKGTGNGKLSVTGMNLTRASSTNGVQGTFHLQTQLQADSIETHSGVIFQIDDGIEVTSGSYIHRATNADVLAKTIINGTLNVTNFDMAQYVGATEISIGSSGSLNATSIESTASEYSNPSSTVPFNNQGLVKANSLNIPFNIVNNGTITTDTTNGDASITATSFSGNGSINLNGRSTSLSVTNESSQNSITISDTDATISGNYNLTNFNASTDMGNKTLIINGSQTITGTTAISGDSTNNLTVSGTGSLSLTNPLIANYLTFPGTGPAVTTANAYAKNSTGSPTGWAVVSGEEHVWNGSTTNWSTTTNWLPQSVPTGSDDVIINEGTPYPKITSDDAIVKSITFIGDSNVEVASGGKLTIADDATLSNKISGAGALVLADSKTYSIPDPLSINIENNGTISGNTTITGNLKNSASITGNVSVTGTFTNESTGTVTGDVSVTGSLINSRANPFGGTITVSGNVTDNGGITSAITLAGTGAHTFTGKGDATNYSIILNDSGSTTFKDSITLTSLTESSYSGSIIFIGTGDQTIPAGNYSRITVNKTSGNFIANGNTTITTFTQTAGDVVFNGDLNVKSYNHTNGAITLEGNTTFTDGSSYTAADFGSAVISISAGTELSPKTITATSFAAGSIICTDGASVDAATSYLDIEASGGITITNDIGGSSNYYKKVVLNAGSSDISIGGNIYTSEITVGCKDVEFSNKIFVGSVTIAATGAVSINSLEAQSLTINSGSPIKMAGTIKLKGSNDFIINYPLLLSNDTEFDVAGKIIIQDSGIIKADSSAGKNLTLTASSIQLDNENPLGDNTTGKLGTITINSPITLNSDSAIYSTETVFEGTGAKTVTGNHVLTQNGNLEIPSSKEWTFNNQFVVNGNLTNSGTVSFADDIDVNGNITNSGNSTFDDVNVIGNVTDTGAWTQTTGILTFDGSGTDAQIFTPKAGTSYAKITLNKSAGSFETDASYALTAGSFTITACPSTRFEGEITFDFFGNSDSTTETISFGKNATINSAATFNRPVTISGAATIQTTSGGQTYKESVTVNANAKLKAPAGQTITFEKTLSGDGSKDLTIDTANSVFNDAVSGIQNLTTEGTVTANSITVTAKKVTFKNDVSGTGLVINADDVVVDTAGDAAINTSGNQTYNARVTLNKATTFTAPQVNFNGNVSNSGSAALIVAGATFINTAEIATTGATQTYNGNVTIQQNTTLTASQINYSNDINGTGKTLTINASVLNSTKTGSAGAITVDSLNLLHSVGLTSDATGGITLNVNNITKTNGSVFTLTNNTALTVSDGIIINPDFINGATGTFSASSGTTIFKGNLNLSAGTFVHSSGTVKLTGENAVLDGGGKAFNNLVIENSVTIKGSNSFVNLTAENLGGKTIKFEAGATQTVSTLLKLQGISATSMLNLRSTTDNSAWIIKCTADSTTSHNIQFADVKDGNNISDSGTPPAVETYNLFAMSSKDRGHNTNWNFPGMEYKWNGATDNSWATATNWEPASVPNIGTNIVIPGGLDNYPNITSAISLNQGTYLGSVTIEKDDAAANPKNGQLTISTGGSFTVDSITNNGIITFAGGSLSATSKSNGDNSESKIVYDGTNSSNWLDVYNNLEITNGNSLTLAAATSVNNLLTNSGTITNNAVLNVNKLNSSGTINGSGDQNYTGAVTLSGATTLSTSSGTISFSETSSITGNSALSVTGTTNINCASITTTGDQTYNSAVNLKNSGTTAITGANIDFKNTINGSNTFIVSATSTTFENTVGATTSLTSLSVNGTANINCSSIKTTNGQTYDAIVLQQNSLFTGSLITLRGSVSDNTTPPVVSYELTVIGNAETALGSGEAISIPVQINGSLTNTNTGNASFDNDIKVTGNVTDNGTWNSADGKKLIFNGTGAQSFKPLAATTYKSILINKTAGSFTTNTNALKVSSFADSATNASTIAFATNTTIGSDVEFHTDKPVTFTNTTNVLTSSSPTSYHNLTHTAGLTKVEGTITAGNVTLRNVELTGDTTLTAHGDVQFNNDGTVNATIDGAHNLTITANETGKSITFNGNIGTTDIAKLTSLSITGKTNINCTSINTSDDQTFNGTVTLKDGGTTAITGANVTFSNTVNGNNSLTVTSNGDGKFTTFKGNIGTTTAKELTSLTVNGNTKTGDASGISIITSGNQTYNGTVTLNKSTTFTARTTGATPANQTVNFKYNVTGSSANTILVCNADMQVESITIYIAEEIDFAGNIIGTASNTNLTINAPVFKSTIASDTAEITLGHLTFTHTSTSLETANNTYINLNVPDIKGVDKTIVIDETLKNITLTSTSVTVEPTIQTETGSKLTVSSGTTTFKADVSLADGTLDANGGTIIVTAQNKTGDAAAILSGNNAFNNLTFTGAVNLTGNNTINGTLLLTGTAPVKIGGSNTINNFTAGTSTEGLGGKTITFGYGTTQEVSVKLSLRGTAKTDGNRLNLRSSDPTTTSGTGTQWKINCTGSNEHDIEFVDIQDSNNITSSYYLFALNSIDHGNNTKWNFPGMRYKWKGTDSTNWNDAANWEYLSIPGKGADIEIPAGCTNYPILEAALNLNETYNTTEYKGKITIKQKETGKVEGKFDLAGYNLTLGEIINYGLVRLKGSQAINGIMKNGEDGQKGTVEYYDNDPAAVLTSFVWDGDGNSEAGKKYYNLIINKNINQATGAGEQIKVSGTTTISAGNGKTVTLNNASNIFTGNVIAGSSADTSFIAGAVTLRAGSLITLENNANADSLTVNSAVKLQKVTTSEDQTYNGLVTVDVTTNLIATDTGKHIYFNNNVSGTGTLSAQAANININCDKIESTGNQTYTGAVALDKNTELKSTSGGISFTSTVDGAKTLKLTSSSGTTFGGLVGGTVGAATNLSSLEVNGPAIINTSSVTTSGAQTYKGAVSLGQDTTLTSTGDNIALNTTLNGAHTITFSVPADATNTITVVGKVGGDSSIATPPSITIAQAGTVTFKETVKANALTLTKANSTTFEKAVDITSFADDTTNHTGTVTFAAGGIIQNNVTFNTNNTVSFTGTMNIGAEGSRKDLTHTTGNTTINGTLNAANVEMADTSTIGAISATTTQIHNLTLTGDTTITTSGTQTYNGTINDATAGEHTLSLNSGTSQITFASSVGQTADPKVLTVNGPVAINGAAVTTTDEQNYNAAITSTGTITLKSAALNLNCSTVTTADAQTYDGPVNLLSDTTLTLNTGDLHLKSPLNGEHKFTIAKTNDANFDGAVTVTDFEITLANDTQFAEPVAVTNFAITTANNTQFDKTVQISNFTDAATAGNISFNAGGTISAATGTTFLTTGTVTFGDNQSDIMTFGSASPYADLKHTAGDTNITGLINAANITLAQTAGGPMTIANSGLFKTIDGAALTYTTSFTQNGTGNSVIGGSFAGNGNASFATNVQIFGSSQADFGSNGIAVSITKNLIILRDATDDLNINSRVNVTENLILYKGPVVANADITAGKDILILGSAYSTTDTSTGITNEYAYDCVRPETWSQPNYTETLLPDGYTSTLSVASAKTITAGKNFYANGTTLQTAGTTGQWTLKIPNLTNAANAFAEAYHSEISGCKVICNDGTSTDGTKSRLVCLECDDTSTTNTPNTNVDFDDFEITAAWTERDNSIRVEFNRPVRYYDATVQTLKFQNAEGSPVLNFTGLYSDPDCQNEIVYDSQLSYFYIKAAPQNDSQYGAWNTDATGRSSGAADDQSTDRSGIHHENIPALDFARALINGTTTQSFIFTDRWGKRLNNYSSRTPTAKAAYGSTGDTETSHEVADKTGPVLYSVRTGQELHDAYNPSTGASGEHSYDSHNFIEFVYSEKVDFDGSSDDTTLNDSPATAENVQVNDALGAVKGDITKSDNLQLAGLGILEHGLLHTGKNGSTDKYVSALYRKGGNAEYAIRLSIAGYTDPSVTLTDDSGYTYKKWIGYIEQATMPSGTVKHLVDSNKKNERVKDKEGNVQIKYADNSSGEPVFDTIPTINSTEDGTFGAWDLSEPVFALYRQNATKTHWEQSEFDKNYYAEAIGNNSGVGSTLDRIEFHLYDNTPEFDEQGSAVTGTPEWFTEVGWCNPNSIGEKPQDLYKSYSYAADIFGGARPFDSNASRRTSGGIRYSTIYSSVNAFKYGVGSALQERLITTSFNNSKIGIPGASSLIFTGTSSPRRSAGDSEGLYFALPLANTSLDIKTSFTVKYDDSVGFITDLAGNRLRTKIFSTIDRTPPSIDMTVCPVGGDEMEIIFVKELCIDSDKLEYNDNTTGEKVAITEQFDSLITNCFDFITINSSGTHQVATDLTVDHTVPAKITVKENQNGSAFTIIHLKLSRTVTLDDIKNKFIRVIYAQQYGEYSVDLFTGHPGSRVTFIQDEGGNNIQMYTAHALSDFAVGVIDPLYAYDSAMIEEDGTIISDSLFRANLTDDVDEKGWAVHDWNRDQKNYGTLPAKRPVAIVADTADGTEENDDAPVSFRLYLSNNPDAASVSTQYNKDLEPDTQWRIWLPNEMSGVFTSLSEKNNTNYSQVDGTLLSDDISNRMIFDVGQTIVNQWAAGNQISFLFGLTNSDGSPVTIMHSPELDINNDKQYLSTSAKMPLFALRQTEPANLMSLDLWSFRLKDVVSQRGGVTILNNVINSSQREKVVVKVNQPMQGNLTVLVMTLDGSIVDYLHRGTSEAGEHFYSWDGTNRRGHSVARGMYFIRVTGPGIDETRKVMVVKD